MKYTRILLGAMAAGVSLGAVALPSFDEYTKLYDENYAVAKPLLDAMATNNISRIAGMLRERLWRNGYTGWYWGDYARAVRTYEDYCHVRTLVPTRQQPVRDFWLGRGAIMGYVGLGRTDRAADVCREFLFEVKNLKPAERYELSMTAAVIDAKGDEGELVGIVRDADKRFAAETAIEPKTRADSLDIVGSYANVANREALVRAIKKVQDGLYVPCETKRYTVAFTDVPVNGPDGWDALSVKPEISYMDRAYGGSTEYLYTDVATGDRGKDVGKGTGNGEFRPGEIRLVADAWGLHFRFEYFATNAQDVANGLVNAATYEAYLAPGEGQPYNCALIYGGKRLEMYNTTYTTRGHREIPDPGSKDNRELGETRAGISFTTNSVCTYYAISWDSFAEVLPKDGTVWDFEVVRWCTLKKQPAWNGLRTIHARSSWGKLVFKLPDTARVKILRQVLGVEFGNYAMEKQNWKRYGIVCKLTDPVLGDPEFFEAEVKPTVECFDGAEKKWKAGLADREVIPFADEFLRPLRDFAFVVDEKHARWKAAKLERRFREGK